MNGYYKFDNFELDAKKRRLLRDGEPVPLNPKAFDLLVVLIENNGELLTKDDIFRLVWNDQAVEESNLTVNMSAIRKALGERANSPRYITTVSGRGYYFTAELVKDAPDENLVIESHTVSRIVVEDEVEPEDSEKVIHVQERPALQGAPESFFKRYRLIIIGAGLLAMLSVGGYLLFRGRGRANSTPFQNLSIKRLTTSGKATNTALSPDGKLFVFSQEEHDGKQSLKLEHIDGSGQLQLLPPADVVFTSLVFAPDGSRIFYNLTSDTLKNGALFRIPVFGGTPEKVKENLREHITFAPDGKQFAFVRIDSENRKTSLLIAETGSDTMRELGSRPLNLGFLPPTPAWSPDGKMIAVAAYNGNSEMNEIFVVTVSDGTIKKLSPAEWNVVRALAWTKDGNDIVAVAEEKDATWESQLWDISYPDGAARRLIFDLNTYSAVISLSDDGSLLTVQAQHYSNIWVAPANNLGTARQVTFDMLGRLNGWDGLDWMPDGRVIFTAITGKSETIWTMDGDGANQKQLIPEGRINDSPSISDDGRYIVFASNRSGGGEIWRANGDGTNMKQLTAGGSNYQPHISPDGRFVVYQSLRDGVRTLWRVSTEGGEPLRLTDRESSWPRFSPDGKFIACGYQMDGKRKLAILSTDGKLLKAFDVPATGNFRIGIHWMPDGSGVTYRDWNNGVWRQNLEGGEPVRLEGLPQEKLYSYGWSHDGKSFAYTRGTEIRDVVLISNSKP